MLTKTLAGEIVRQCIREVLGRKQATGRSSTLSEMGIGSAARVASLRKALIRHLAARGFEMPERSLEFTGRTVLADLVTKIARQAVSIEKKRAAKGARAAKPIARTAIVRHMAEKLELTNKQVSAFFDLLTETAVKETKKNGVFVIPGLGRLVKAERKARMGRNPQTGEQIKIKAKTAVKFRPAKSFTDIVESAKKGAGKKIATMDTSGSVHRYPHPAPPSRRPIWRRSDLQIESSDLQIHDSEVQHDSQVRRWDDEYGGGSREARDEELVSGEGSRSGASESPMVTVHATPQMEFSGEPTEPNRYPLAIYLDKSTAAEGAIVEGVVLELPRELLECRVDVWMDCSPQLKIEGLAEDARLTLNVASGVSDKLGLTLTVVEKSKDQPMYVSAFFRYVNRPCGKITRFLEHVGKRLRWKSAIDKTLNANEAPPSGPDLPAVVIEHGAHPADIRVEVTETAEKDGRSYRMKCLTREGKWDGPWTLPMKSDEFVKARMQSFMKTKDVARISSLKGAGQRFWNTLEVEPRTLIAQAIAGGAKTMSILSEEPYIPWELMVPNTTPRDARDPLGITLQIGRWITGKYIAPPQKVRLQSLFVISPNSAGLTTAAKEVKFLLETLADRWSPGDRLSPATVKGIDSALASSSRDVLHFVCHGDSGVLQTLILDTPDELDSDMVLALEGFLAAFKSRPLVFLNACKVGSLTPGLDGVSGFATSFMQLEASAVVAPLWAVQNEPALEVATLFYTAILAGKPFARVFQDIRKRAYTGDDPPDSYAAYCFYGDPLAVAVTA
jgi:nucleoid DNA-binding protein